MLRLVPSPFSASSHRRWIRLVIVAGLLLVAAASPPADAKSDAESESDADAECSPDAGYGGDHRPRRYRALVCWLWKATLSLPDEEYKEGIFTVQVKDMTCTNFRVASMASSSSPAASPGSDGGPSVSVRAELAGMSARCTGRYDGGIGLSGNVVASLGGGNGGDGGPALRLRADASSSPLRREDAPPAPADWDPLPFPSSVALSECASDFLVHDVEFSGSASAKVVGLFSSAIARRVTASINGRVCDALRAGAEPALDRWIGAARGYVGSLLPDGPRSDGDRGGVSLDSERVAAGTTAKRTPEKAVSWDEDMPFLKRILSGLNNLISDHIDEGLILKFLQTLSTWQSTDTTDCGDCGFFFKGFNGLVNSITRGSASLEFPVPEAVLNFRRNHTFKIPDYGDIVLSAQKVRVSGLDEFTDLALFRPEGVNLLASSVASDAGFSVSVQVRLEVRPADGDGAAFRAAPLNETFQVHLNASDVNLKSAAAWDIDRGVFSKLSVGSFIYGSYTMFKNNRNLLNCVVEALRSITVIDVHGRMKLNSMRVSPRYLAYEAAAEEGLEGDVDDLINTVIQSFLTAYPSTTTETLALLLQNPVRKKLNDGFADLIGDTKKMPLHCVNVDVPNNKSEHPLRLDENKALNFFDVVVNDERTVAAVNSFIDCVVNGVESKQLLKGHFYNFTFGELNVVLHDLHVENTNSVYELELLKPEVDHYHLTNSFAYGGTCAAASGDAKGCSSTSFSFGMNLVHSKQGNLGNINYHVSMKGMKLQGGTEIKLDMNYLPYLLVSDLLSHPQCSSIPVTNLQVYGLNSTVEMLDVKIDVSLNGHQSDPHSFTYQTKDSAKLAHAVSMLMSKGSMFLQEAIGSEISMQLNEQAKKVCNTPINPHRSHETKRSTEGAAGWTFLFVAIFVVGNAWLFLRGFKTEEEEALVANEENVVAQPDEQFAGQRESSLSDPLLLNDPDGDEMDEIFEVETPQRKFPLASSSSLMYHRSIHPAVKYGFPAVLALAFTLFISSNAAVGASVDLLVMRADGRNLTSLVNIYAFSLGSTMKEMAQAGVYFLLLLILFCSGIWPYVKLILMMVSWIASTRRLPPVKREKILYLLDCLGKFSLIDAYVLVLMMVAFRYNFSVDGVGALNVYVTPKYGFYSFLFATIISLVSGHFMLFLHRKTMLPSIPVYSGRYESLSKHVFDNKHGRELVKLTKRFRQTLTLTLFVALALICVGISLKSFHFKFSGVAGTALGHDKIRSFSLVSIGKHIPHSVQDSTSFGIHWIQICYFFFAVVMPITCLLSMLVLFLVPMRLKQQQRVFVIAEITNAWSAIEVFVIAIVASLVEISPFAESMVGKHCGLLNQILSGWSGGEGDDLHYCFDVKSSIDGSSAVLIIGVVLNSLLVSLLHRFAHHSIAERIEREDRPDATEEENRIVRDCVLAHSCVTSLRKRPRLGAFMFEEVSFGPDGEYEIDFENVAETEEPHTSNNFWSEWSKIVSVI